MTTDQVTVAILGGGSWGTTFAKVLAEAAQGRNESITIRYGLADQNRRGYQHQPHQ